MIGQGESGRGKLTVCEASGHARGGEGIALLGVHQLADGWQFIHLAVRRGAGAERGLGRHRAPAQEEQIKTTPSCYY